MRSTVNVPLTDTGRETLIRVAARERRHPREQAAYLLERALVQESERLQRCPDGTCREAAHAGT